MAGIKLKRLLGRRKPLRGILEAVATARDARFWVEGPLEGTAIHGEVSELNETIDIIAEEQRIGRIHASQGAEELAKLVHGFVSLELEKRDLAAEVLDRYRELNLLYDLAEKLTACHDVPSIGSLVLEEAQKVAPSDWGQVLVISEDSVSAVATLGELEVEPDCPLIQRVRESLRAEMLEDHGENEPLRSWVVAPIKSISGLIGMVILGNREPRAYNSGTLKLVTSLAGQCAPAIESTRLTDYQRALARSFARFVPDEFIGALDHQSVVEVDTGEHARKEMSVFFSDIRAFTTLVEGKTPEESYRFINEYLLQMEPGIRDHQGFIAEVVGDAIMALFSDGGADNAVRAAIACQRSLTDYNQRRLARGEQEVLSGIGISSGELMLGTIGSPERIKCGVIGDAVNTAARVEGLTKHYGAGILITHHTREQLDNASQYEMRPVDRIRAKGKKRPMVIYEILNGLTDDIMQRRLQARGDFLKGWELYQQGQPGEALVAFAAALSIDADDRVTRLYLGRCWQLLENGMPDDWDGVVDMRVK